MGGVTRLAELEGSLRERDKNRENLNETLKTINKYGDLEDSGEDSDIEIEGDLELEMIDKNIRKDKNLLKKKIRGKNEKTYAEAVRTEGNKGKIPRREKILTLVQSKAEIVIDTIADLIKNNIDPEARGAKVKSFEITRRGKILIETGAEEERENLERVLMGCIELEEKCIRRRPMKKKVREILLGVPENVEQENIVSKLKENVVGVDLNNLNIMR